MSVPGIAEVKEGVDRWSPTVTVQDLFGPAVKGRVLLDSLFELYQATNLQYLKKSSIKTFIIPHFIYYINICHICF